MGQVLLRARDIETTPAVYFTPFDNIAVKTGRINRFIVNNLKRGLSRA
jgi:hypothetical protein